MYFTGFLLPGASPEAIEETVSRLPQAARAHHDLVTSGSAAVLAPPESAYCAEGVISLVFGHLRWSGKIPAEVGKAPRGPEALWRAYRALGPELAGLLGGHFACALLDSVRQRVLLAVDRVGTAPVYWAVGPGGALAFGSRPDGAALAAGIELRLSDQALYEYLYFHMIPSPDSVFEGVKKLTPASCLVYEDTQVREHDYWQPEFHTEGDLGALREELLSTLETCVADASVLRPQPGAFLSGGLDSSTVAGMLARTADTPVPTYSIGFDAEGYDETAYARIAAEHFGTEQHEYFVTPSDVVDSVPRIADALDEPFGNSSVVPTYFCAKLAAEDSRSLLLAGDGGDELFAGNERYRKQLVFERYAKVPAILRRGLLEPLLDGVAPLRRLPLMGKGKSYIDQARIPLPDRLQTYNYLHRYAPREIFAAEFIERVDTERPLNLQRDRYLKPAGPVDPVDRMLFLDWKLTLADNDLRKVSSMCALEGVEVAYPMLDDRVLELACRIPPSAKLTARHLRRFYREAMRGFLPEATLGKHKHGFGLPFGVWMREHPSLREMAYDSLGALKARGIVDSAFIDQAIAMHSGGHAAYFGELVWVLVMLEMWMKRR